MLKPFSTLQVKSDEINRIQDNVSTALKPVTAVEFLDGQSLEDLALTAASPVTVNHKLGRPVKQLWVTKLEVNAVIWSTQSADPTNTIILNTTADATVNVWVA